MNSYYNRFLATRIIDRNDMLLDFNNFLDVEFSKFMFRLQLGDKLSAELKNTKGHARNVKFKMTSIPIGHFIQLVKISNGVVQHWRKAKQSKSVYQSEIGHLNKHYLQQDKFTVQICCVHDLFPFLGHGFFRYPIADSDFSGGGCPARFPFSQYHLIESKFEFKYDMINQTLEVSAPTKGIPRSETHNSTLPTHPSLSSELDDMKNELVGKFVVSVDDTSIGYEICMVERTYGGYKDTRGIFISTIHF